MDVQSKALLPPPCGLRSRGPAQVRQKASSATFDISETLHVVRKVKPTASTRACQEQNCKVCHGSGLKLCTSTNPFHKVPIQREACPSCGGRGKAASCSELITGRRLVAGFTPGATRVRTRTVEATSWLRCSSVDVATIWRRLKGLQGTHGQPEKGWQCTAKDVSAYLRMVEDAAEKTDAADVAEGEERPMPEAKRRRGPMRLQYRISDGSFGQVYRATKDEKHFAIKVPKDDVVTTLTREYHFLLEVQGGPGIPCVFPDECSGPLLGKTDYIVMELLGPSLAALASSCRSFTGPTCGRIARQLLDSLKHIHAKNIVHRDLKPSNICCGYSDGSRIFIVDFGMSDFVGAKGSPGNLRFSSISAHNRLALGRQSDMESLVFMLMHFWFGKLPWQALTIEAEICQSKCLNFAALCANLPENLRSFIQKLESDYSEEDLKCASCYEELKKTVQDGGDEEPMCWQL